MSIGQWCGRGLARLVEPHWSIVDVGDRLGARLFGILMLIHAALIALMVPVTEFVWRRYASESIWRDPDMLLVVGAGAVILAAFALIRTGRFRAGALLYIAIAALVPLVAPFIRNPSTEIGLLATAILPVLLTAIVFPFRWVLCVLFVTVAVGAAQLLTAGLDAARTGTGFAILMVVAVVGGLILVFRHHLGVLERWRLGQIREREAKYRQLFETVTDAVLLADGRGTLLEVNQTACRQLGYTREQLVGQPIEWVTDGLPRETAASLAAIPVAGQAVFETTFRRRDGSTYPVELAVTSVEFAGEKSVLGVARDISERQRVAEEKRRLADQLQQAAKMESIGQLAGGVAHDFNNLLTAILGNAALMLEDVPAHSQAAGSLRQILEAGDTAARLTRQLLAFSRKQLIAPRVVDLKSRVDHVERMLTTLVGPDVRLEVRHGSDVGAIKVDPGLIEQVLVSLAVNASDAMPSGGSLILTTARVSVDDDHPEPRPDVTPGEYVALTVTDTGTGMPPEVQARLFEPFFTTKPRGRGTGLGLAAAYGAVKQSGGDILVESEPGRGTKVRIFLPCLPARDEADLATSERKPA